MKKPTISPKTIISVIFALIFITYSMERFMSEHYISSALGGLMVAVFVAVAVRSIPNDKEK